MTAPSRRKGVLAFIERRLAGTVVPSIAFGYLCWRFALTLDVAVALSILWANATTAPARWLSEEKRRVGL